MVEVTIVCLIYKSKKLAQAVYESLYKYTPKLNSGEADLLFIANDPTVELVEYLKVKKYPYIINVNDRLSDDELFSLGYGTPEYMRRVYQGYNKGILSANGQKVVLINSDNFFSKDWLENLLKYSDYKKVVTSTLVEPGQEKFGVFPGAVEKDFGRIVEDYKDGEFQDFASKIRKTGYSSGGAYMPCLLYKDIAIMAGLYPGGNIAGKSFRDISRYGDEHFYDVLKSFGVDHITAKDSIVYHLKEGEKSEKDEDISLVTDEKYKYIGLGDKYFVGSTNLMPYIKPESNHQDIIDQLGQKYTFLITNFASHDELMLQVNAINKIDYKNIEITVVYNNSNKEYIGKKLNGLKYIFSSKQKKDVLLYNMFYGIFGEYLLVSRPDCNYKDLLLTSINEKTKVCYFGLNKVCDGLIIDDISKFIIPKNVLIKNIGAYLDYIINNTISEYNADDCICIYPQIEDVPAEDVVVEVASASTIRKRSLPYRAARKLYREGVRGFTTSIVNRVRRHQ